MDDWVVIVANILKLYPLRGLLYSPQEFGLLSSELLKLSNFCFRILYLLSMDTTTITTDTTVVVGDYANTGWFQTQGTNFKG